MRRISAQYLFTSCGKPLKRGVVTVADDNTIVSVEDNGGDFSEKANTEFYNGIIIPGLVNCHTHLELSHMAGALPAGGGLADFITSVREQREALPEEIVAAAKKGDGELTDEGIVACGDISNNSLSFSVKRGSRVDYLTFIEVFGIDPGKAQKRIDGAVALAAAAAAAGLPHHITPHAVYSVSRRLLTLTEQHISPASVTSLHFLESPDERDLVRLRRGRLAESYLSLGVTPEMIDTPDSHLAAALGLSQLTAQLILVHNTFITAAEIQSLRQAGNVWFCLCPSSNIRISATMPPVRLLREASDRIVTGTDSLASTDRLSILNEMRLLHDALPEIPLDEIVRWGTINGAKALGKADMIGSIEPGKKPGLLLVENTDLQSLRLTPQSRVRRLL
ncbi:MAG: amidohydrolase family protein [Bacteroidales bacterium]|nr:amidohydrolase family protein [Bacteroidales bacterium]